MRPHQEIQKDDTNVYITGGLRTFICSKGKTYRRVPAEDLAAAVIGELHERNKKIGLETDFVAAGNATGGGGNIARLSLLKAGLPDGIPALTVDAQCASGMEAVIESYARIRSGLAGCAIAGGAESASTACRRSYSENHPNFDGAKKSNEYATAQFVPETFAEDAMTRGADEAARRIGATEEELAKIAEESHARARRARDEGLLSPVILGAFGAKRDELIRPSLSASFAERLPPLRNGGITNAATSCLFSDGAAFVSLSGRRADFFGSGHSFRILGAATVGSDRMRSPEGMARAVEKVLERTGTREDEIGRIDYNEAFAVVTALYRRRFGNESNIAGGALAYGHPFGASGAVVLLHLLCAMERSGDALGIAAVPAAGGIASAVLVAREKIGG